MKPPLAWSQLGAHFADEDKAREYLEFLRWGSAGPACPRCGGDNPYRLTPKATSDRPGRKGLLKCRACRKQFTVTVGTVFEDSHIKLTKWIQGIYLIGASKKGTSAHQLHRMLGITYRAAWFMAHRLRYAMETGSLMTPLSGTAEVAKRDPLKLPDDLERNLRALLRAPPPPAGTPGSRKAEPQAPPKKPVHNGAKPKRKAAKTG